MIGVVRMLKFHWKNLLIDISKEILIYKFWTIYVPIKYLITNKMVEWFLVLKIAAINNLFIDKYDIFALIL